MPGKMVSCASSEQQEKISRLERELEKLRESTKLALETSWAETERLQQANAASTDRITHLEAFIDQNNIDKAIHQQGGQEGQDNHERVKEWWQETVKTPFRRWNMHPHRRGPHSSGECTDEDLMNQLSLLQEDQRATVTELQIKLQQREAAISTLEGALKLRDETVASLRNDLKKQEEQNQTLKRELNQKNELLEMIRQKNQRESTQNSLLKQREKEILLLKQEVTCRDETVALLRQKLVRMQKSSLSVPDFDRLLVDDKLTGHLLKSKKLSNVKHELTKRRPTRRPSFILPPASLQNQDQMLGTMREKSDDNDEGPSTCAS